MRKSPAIAALLLVSFLPLRIVRAEANHQAKLWFALRAAAARHGATLPEQIWPEDIYTSAPQAVLESDSPLEIRAISFDPALHQLRFRFRPAGNGSAPWFSAWCPFFEPRPLSGSPPSVTLRVQPTETAVSTHRFATLQLRSDNSSATLQVRPLENGVVGQSIRVRIPSNGHTLRARITGADLLEAQF